MCCFFLFFFFQAEDGIRDADVTGVQTCALPISAAARRVSVNRKGPRSPVARVCGYMPTATAFSVPRSEEHTSELQSRPHLVCRLLLEKKNRTSAFRLRPQTA